MRGWALVVLVAACRFRTGVALVDGDTSDVPVTFDDSGHEIDTWVIDTATDFAKGTRVELGIEPSGAITPAGYAYGSVFSSGAEGAAIWHTTDTSFSVDAAASTTPTGAQLYLLNAVTPTSDLASLGIADGNFSAWSIGEVYLTQGTYTFQLQANDVGFAEIALPHTATFTDVVASTGAAIVTATYYVPTTDWYPIRTGLTSTSAAFQYDLQITPPATAAPRHFARNEIRGRVEEARGLMQILYRGELITGSRSSHVVAADALASLSLPLYGQPGNQGAFSVRFAGQFYAKDAGSYVLQASSVAGDRVFAGGQTNGSNFAREVSTSSTSTATIASTGPGWYDAAFDINEPPGAAPSLAISVASGPELVGMPLPLQRLRPVEPPVARVAQSNSSPRAASRSPIAARSRTR
jgi:hypothetical protein